MAVVTKWKMSREYYKKISWTRKSTLTSRRPSLRQPKLVRTFQPTYQLNPRRRFDPEKIQKVLKRIIDDELAQIEYSEKVVPDLCLSLSETIRNTVKEENYNSGVACLGGAPYKNLFGGPYEGYRIIVSVSIGQRRQQGVHIFHTFLWDHERDSFASYNYENPHLFANVLVYGVYLD